MSRRVSDVEKEDADLDSRRSIEERGVELESVCDDFISESRGPPQDPMINIEAYEENTYSTPWMGGSAGSNSVGV